MPDSVLYLSCILGTWVYQVLLLLTVPMQSCPSGWDWAELG